MHVTLCVIHSSNSCFLETTSYFYYECIAYMYLLMYVNNYFVHKDCTVTYCCDTLCWILHCV